MANTRIIVVPPLRGVIESSGYDTVPSDQTAAAVNVSSFSREGELRISKRHGTSRAIAEALSGPVRRMTQVTLSADAFIDPSEFFTDPLYTVGSGQDGLGFGGGFLRPKPTYAGSVEWPHDDQERDSKLIFDSGYSDITGILSGYMYDNSVFGQLLTIPDGYTRLNKVSVRVSTSTAYEGLGTISFRLKIWVWDNDAQDTIGSPLYVSSWNPTVYTDDPPVFNFAPNIAVTPGVTYIIGVDVSENPDPPIAEGGILGVGTIEGSKTIPGDGAVWYSNWDDAWYRFIDYADPDDFPMSLAVVIELEA